MKMLRYLLLVVIAAAILVPGVAFAQGILDAERLSVIQDRCSVLQTSLDQIQRRDLVSRTDHGREYENITKQINAFAQRLRNNNIPTQLLDARSSDFTTAVTAFREAYIRYDDSMNALRDIDCRNHAGDFAEALEKSRVLRAEIGSYVTQADTALEQYRQAILALQITLPAKAVRSVQ